MNLHHVFLPGGEMHVTPHTAVTESVLSLVRPWLDQVLATGERRPLALPAVAHYSASAKEHDNALLVTLWSPAGACHGANPHGGPIRFLSTFGVARNKAGGEQLWAHLLATGFALAWQPPYAAPWCMGLPPIAGLAARPKVLRWLPDVQSAIAFAWLRRPRESRSPHAAGADTGQAVQH
jgi:hypothetical protein